MKLPLGKLCHVYPDFLWLLTQAYQFNHLILPHFWRMALGFML
uniref:Uncharacterized protein n=1 Tax=Anguilla anguilla TaxID=7936 RepID=A0A0E9R860_ANGAN